MSGHSRGIPGRPCECPDDVHGLTDTGIREVLELMFAPDAFALKAGAWCRTDRRKQGTRWNAVKSNSVRASSTDAAGHFSPTKRGFSRTKVKPIARANTRAWRMALKRAGIADFRWHDLRHTWASWLVQHGTALYVVQEMGAWESAEMVRRYAHLAPAPLAKHAEVVAGLLSGTNASQEPKDKGLAVAKPL